MDIYLQKIRLVNFKIFEDETICCNKEMNIFVGDNGAGKSSILQALDMVLCGSVTRVESIGLENLLNANAVLKWMGHPTLESLPIMRVELFFEMPDTPKTSRYNGEKYLDGRNRPLFGIKMICAPNQDFEADILACIREKKAIEFPFEFYKTGFTTFSDESYSGYIKPCKSLYIDNTAINTAKTLRYVVERTYKNAVEDNNRVSTQYGFRQHIASFPLPQPAVDKNLIVTGDLESYLDIKENGIRLLNQGEGRISICKTDSALDKNVDDISILSIEEPENHLSHYNLKRLISKIKERAADRQIFIVTHSSYITSRLGLQNTFFVNGKIQSLTGLSKATGEFFMKAPNDNLLQFVLSKKVLLVEGAAEYILMDRFVNTVKGLDSDTGGVWIMALNNLSFRRYLEVGKILNIKVAAVRDNDRKPQCWYPDLQDNDRKVFSDSSAERYTFEVCLYNDNKDALDRLFHEHESALDYMLEHKAEAAYQILSSGVKLNVPQYIREAIEWLM